MQEINFLGFENGNNNLLQVETLKGLKNNQR
jgi:hypothetical protein